jgi:hypothetical protein
MFQLRSFLDMPLRLGLKGRVECCIVVDAAVCDAQAFNVDSALGEARSFRFEQFI